jgi:hypothetical protein
MTGCYISKYTPCQNQAPLKNTTKLFLLFLIFLPVLYLVQAVLALIFHSLQPNDTDIMIPFQNHYLSFSDYFITLEGMSGEFTSDMTAVGRFLGLLIPTVIGMIILLVILYLIKPLRKYYGNIFMGLLFVSLAFIFIKSFFVPDRKTVFDLPGKQMLVTRNEWIFNPKNAEVPFSAIENFDYSVITDDSDYEHVDVFYIQIYAVVGGKRFLIGENQMDEKTGAEAEAHKAQAEEVIALLKQITGLKVSPN